MTARTISLETLPLRLKHSFRTSRASVDTKETIIARYGNGIGEGSPSVHYGLSAKEIIARFEELSVYDSLDSDGDICLFIDSLPSILMPLRCALEMVWLDRKARHHELPLWQYLELERPGTIRSSFTITRAEESDIEKQLETAHAFGLLKLKVGFDHDLDFVDQALRYGDFSLRLDANGGWDCQTTIEKLRSLGGYPIEFIEQPLADPTPSELDKIKTKVECSLFLDESIKTEADIQNYAHVIDGVNLKLSKCGGIRPVVRMAALAHDAGLKLLLGCMLETTVGITAAAHLSSLFDHFDLDSILLIEDDPFWGAHFDGDQLILPAEDGIGIRLDDSTYA